MRRSSESRWIRFSPACGLAIACAIIAQACDDDSFVFALDAGNVPQTYSDLCAAFAARQCGTCAESWTTTYSSQSQCVERQTISCQLALADPSVNANAAAVSACGSDVPSDASCPLAVPQLARCLGPGALPNGASCLWSAACQSSVCLATEADPVTFHSLRCGARCLDCRSCPSGACTWNDADGGVTCQSFAAVGEACDFGSMGCAGDTFCGPDLRCTPHAAVGEPCSPSDPSGFVDGGTSAPRCQGSLYCASGFCAPKAQLGQACGGDGGAPCDPSSAPEGTFCGERRVCDAVELRAPGERCDGKGAVCAGTSQCADENAGSQNETPTGVCTGPLADGLGPCDVADGVNPLAFCLPPAECIGGLCVYPSAAACAAQ